MIIIYKKSFMVALTNKLSVNEAVIKFDDFKNGIDTYYCVSCCDFITFYLLRQFLELA